LKSHLNEGELARIKTPLLQCHHKNLVYLDFMRFHEQGPVDSPAVPEPTERHLTREERLARIQELGERGALMREVYGLVARKLVGTSGTAHDKLWGLIDESAPGANGSSLRESHKRVLEDIASFETELFSLLSRSLHLSEDDMEVIKTQWQLDNLSGRGRIAL
jgi:hypothetical protein